MAKRYYKLETSTGKVLASYARNQPGVEGLQYLDEPEIENASWNGAAWVENADLVVLDYQKQIADTDKGLIRGIEDLIDVLTSTGTVAFEDFPEPLREKYNARKALREYI